MILVSGHFYLNFMRRFRWQDARLLISRNYFEDTRMRHFSYFKEREEHFSQKSTKRGEKNRGLHARRVER